MTALKWSCVLSLVTAGLAVGPARAGAQAAAARLPGVGEVVTIEGIRVTLLGAERLAAPDRQTPYGPAADGFRIVWLAENRPGASIPPALGEVEVWLGERLYNPVTNAASSKPFAPGIVIHDVAHFLAGRGATLRAIAPAPRPQVVAVILECFIYGGPVPAGTDAVGAIELGTTEGARREGDRIVHPPGWRPTFHWFRFRLPG